MLVSRRIEGVGMAGTELIQVTYREIAERFAIGIEGARIKAKRRAAKGEWRIIPGNHPQDIVRVEMPADEFRVGPPNPPRTPPHDRAEGLPTANTQQELQRRDTNDLETLVAVVSQLTQQSQAMVERLIEAERRKSEAERDTAIAHAELKVLEERVLLLQEQHLCELKAVQERLAEEGRWKLDQAAGEAEGRERELQSRVATARADLIALQSQGEAETAQARDQLAAWKARPWWRRMVG